MARKTLNDAKNEIKISKNEMSKMKIYRKETTTRTMINDNEMKKKQEKTRHIQT